MDIVFNSDPKGLKFSTDLAATTTFEQQVAQRLFVRFETLINTWFLNLDYGVDYFNSVLGKGRTKEAADIVVRNTILQEKYVKSISAFSSQIIDRSYSCNFTVQSVTLNKTVKIYLLLTNNKFTLKTDKNLNLTIAR